MQEIKINELLDLTQTEFADIFDACEYPFEILKKIGSYIIEIGRAHV